MRRNSETHLKFIRTLPCLACPAEHQTEAAHVRMSDARIGKCNPGVGQKPHDYFTVPLCSNCHREQHAMSEEKFWRALRKDPVLTALALYAVSGDYSAGLEIIKAQRVL